MATKGTSARILVEEWDLSCETSNVTVTIAMSEEDCTTLCSTAAEYTAILPSMSINQDGYMAEVDEDGSLEKELYNAMGETGHRVAAMFGIEQVACPVYILDSTFGSEMEIAAPATGVITINGAWGQGTGGKRGIRLLDEVISATGTQTPVDVGAGTDGGYAYVFVQDIVGSLGTATILVQSATTSGGSYSTLATLSPTDVGSQRIAWSGASSRWLRVNVTSLGGATSLDLVVAAFVNGVTQ